MLYAGYSILWDYFLFARLFHSAFLCFFPGITSFSLKCIHLHFFSTVDYDKFTQLLLLRKCFSFTSILKEFSLNTEFHAIDYLLWEFWNIFLPSNFTLWKNHIGFFFFFFFAVTTLKLICIFFFLWLLFWLLYLQFSATSLWCT